MNKLKYITMVVLTIFVFLFVPLVGVKKEISNKSSIKLDKEMNMYYIKDTDQELLLKQTNLLQYFGKMEKSKKNMLIQQASQERSIRLAKQVEEKRIAKEKKIAEAKRIKKEKKLAEEKRQIELARIEAEKTEQKRLEELEAKHVTKKEEKASKKTVVVSRGNNTNYTEAYYEVTAYTAGVESTGKSQGDPTYGLTASGKYVTSNVTLACPPSIPFGTKIGIEGYGIRVCHDRGAHIQAGRLDIYMESLSAAQEFGRRTLKVKIYNKS